MWDYGCYFGHMRKFFSLRMATGFSWVAAQLVDMVLELLLGGHCTNVCQTWCFMHIRTGYVRYISLWKMCLFKFFSCYMPTSWEPYHEVEQMYDLMELLLSNCERASAVVGGDFNAMLDDGREADDRDVLGTYGFGERNDRGWMMAHWVARTGLLVQSRLDPYVSVEDSWTCRRAMDGQLVQIDYILSPGNLALVTCKYDHSMPVGLDPRCVHCILQLCVGKRNWRNAFHLRTGGHSWITIMHQHLTRTISDNSCKAQVGLLLIYWSKS